MAKASKYLFVVLVLFSMSLVAVGWRSLIYVRWQNRISGPPLSDLHKAVLANDIARARYLLQHGIAADVQGPELITPLFLAADREMVLLLLNHGANPNATSSHNATPLHFACGLAHPDVIEALLCHGAVIDARDSDGATPLFWVSASSVPLEIRDAGWFETNQATGDYLAAMKVVLRHGPDVNAIDSSGDTALFKAADGQLGIVKALVDAGARINVQDRGNDTPMHCAVFADKVDIARFLLDRGADITIKNWEGKTAFDVADDPETKEKLMNYASQIHH